MMVGGDLSVVADEADCEFDVFHGRGISAGVGDVGVLAGPFDVRLDYGVFRSAFDVAGGLYLRKIGFLGAITIGPTAIAIMLLFPFDSFILEPLGTQLQMLFFPLCFLLSLWFALCPPLTWGYRDNIARCFFRFHGADMEAWNPGPEKRFGDPADCSVQVRVQVRVTELGVEELAGDGSLIRIPFTQMRRWPSMMHGLMSFVPANKDSDSLHLSYGDYAFAEHKGWDGRGVFVPLSSLDRPWVLWRECFGRIREARRRARRSRRWKRLSRVVLFPRGVRDRWADRSEALVARDGCWELAADVFNLVRQHRDGDVSFLDELSGGKEFSSDSIGGVLRDLILETGGNDGAGDGAGAGVNGVNGVNGAAGVASIAGTAGAVGAVAPAVDAGDVAANGVAGVAGAVGAAAPAAAGSGTVFPNSVSWR